MRLTELQIKEIIKESANGITPSKIAEKLGVTRHTIEYQAEKHREEIQALKKELNRVKATEVAKLANKALKLINEKIDDTTVSINQLITLFGVLVDKMVILQNTEREEVEENNSGNIIIAPIKPLEGAENETA